MAGLLQELATARWLGGGGGEAERGRQLGERGAGGRWAYIGERGGLQREGGGRSRQLRRWGARPAERKEGEGEKKRKRREMEAVGGGVGRGGARVSEGG